MHLLKVLAPSAAALIFSIATSASIATAYAGQTTRVSVSSAGLPANAGATNGVLSADGRYVVFQSTSSNLVSGSSGGHVYRHDRTTGVTELVSLSTTRNPGNSVSRDPSVSANGRYVVFSSFATDLVASDANGTLGDVFVRDMQTGTTSLVSASSTGVQGDLSSGLRGLSGAREISDDGRYVAFLSLATNLVAETNNGRQQVYVKDMTTGAVVRASVNDAGQAGNQTSQAPAISGNGLVVAFTSAATNFSPLSNSTQVFVRDLVAGTTTLESAGAAAVGAASTAPVLSSDGRYVAFESATALDPRDRDNGTLDVYLRDRVAGTTVLASLSDLVMGGATSVGPSISSDGRWVGFSSLDDTMVGAGNDTNGWADVFLYDRDDQTVTLVSLNDAGQQATAPSGGASVSSDGHLVLFGSTASNLVTPSTTGINQLYVRNLAANQAPVVNAGADETVLEGEWLHHMASFSDADGSTSWTATADWGAGPFAILLDPNKKLLGVTHEPLTPGTYEITISVTDDGGATGTATFSFTVTNVAPGVDVGAEAFLYFGATLQRSVCLADPDLSVPHPTETYSAMVNYGDGSGTAAAVMDHSCFSLDHTYATPGTYVVAVTASDSNGGVRSAALTVHVYNYAFKWEGLVSDAFIVGRNLPVKFSVRAPDGSPVLDRSVQVDVIDESGAVVAGPYLYGGQPSRSVTFNGDVYHVNVDTKDLTAGMYWLRVRFSSPMLSGEFSLGTTGTLNAVRARLRD